MKDCWQNKGIRSALARLVQRQRIIEYREREELKGKDQLLDDLKVNFLEISLDSQYFFMIFEDLHYLNLQILMKIGTTADESRQFTTATNGVYC